MKRTFVLQEVIDDLVNTDKSLSSPLMKLNYFAKLIKNEELIEYTHQELNGYDKPDKIPSYRKTVGTLYVDFQTYIHQHRNNPLPISMIDPKYREAFKYVHIKEGIASVERLAKNLDNGKSTSLVYRPLPMESLFALDEPARRLYVSDARIDVIAAKIGFGSSVILEIPNAIRTKLLDFVMSIGEDFGYDIEIETFNKKAEINNQLIIKQMHTTINNTGDGNLINTGDNNTFENKVSLYRGDADRLAKELKAQGIDDTDIQEITEIVKEEKPDEENAKIGEKANGWISKVTNKSASGIGKIATGVLANVLASLIKQYYGMP